MKNLTPKFHIGQQVIWIFRNKEDEFEPWQCCVETIESIGIGKNGVSYYPESACADMAEDALFASFDEAMEFLREKLILGE